MGIVERLRNANLFWQDVLPTRIEAADEIERLREALNHACSTQAVREKDAEIERLQIEWTDAEIAWQKREKRLRAVYEAATFLCALLRTRIWEDSEMNACGMKAGDSSDVHLLRRLEEALAAVEGDDG